MVSDEEKTIDFETSVSKEEEMQQEGGPSVDPSASSTSAPAESATFVVELAEEGTIPEPTKPGGAKTIGPKRTGPRSVGASSAGSKAPGSRGRPAMNMELDELLESALKEQDLQGFTPLLVKARMTSVRYLCLHTVEQLEEALKKVAARRASRLIQFSRAPPQACGVGERGRRTGPHEVWLW